jgi:hypothetical protein
MNDDIWFNPKTKKYTLNEGFTGAKYTSIGKEEWHVDYRAMTSRWVRLWNRIKKLIRYGN